MTDNFIFLSDVSVLSASELYEYIRDVDVPTYYILRRNEQILIPVELYKQQIQNIYPKDGHLERYQTVVYPKEHPTTYLIGRVGGDSPSANANAERNNSLICKIPIQPKPVPQPKPAAKPVAKTASPKPVSVEPAVQQLREELRTDGIHTRVGNRVASQRTHSVSPPAVARPKPAAKPVAVPQPKPVAKQPAANPQRRARVLQDDDDDDSDSDDDRIFDPQHPMHPLRNARDEDRALGYLQGRPLSYIKRTLGINSDATATIIKNRGCSYNEAKRIRSDQDRERRQRKAYDRDVERTYQQLRREILAIGEKQQRALQKVDAFADKIGLGQEQQQQ